MLAIALSYRNQNSNIIKYEYNLYKNNELNNKLYNNRGMKTMNILKKLYSIRKFSNN